MRRRNIMIAIAAGSLIGGCRPAGTFSGPAPAGALQCAHDHGLAAGYDLVEGGVSERFLRLSQRLPLPPGDAATARTEPQVGDVIIRDATAIPVENQILVEESRGRLTLTVIGLNNAGTRTGAGSNAEDQARTILALCTVSPPVAPGGQQTPPEPGTGPL